MPASTCPRPHTETLANGLRVTLRHAADLKRCAAVLRVAAGSHDVPSAWPGLAHFLEHLLFLGTERFPAGQALMAYVQGHGGQVNARTSERTTDYFFELPPQAFAGGLERLSDMLAHPCMTVDDQLREREVLQAEWVAWSQDATAQQRVALFDGLSPMHPLRGFHAGNRDSLPVEQASFQKALKDYHQRFYQTGQMTLSLAGPQSIEALRHMAQTFAAALPSGEPVRQQAPPPLMAGGDSHYHQVSEHRLDLMFTFDSLPRSADEALAFLCHGLNAAQPGGLLADLKILGLAEQLKAQPLYQFAGQAVLNVEVTTTQPASAIRERLVDWLGFFCAQQDWAHLRQEYAVLRQCRQQISGALQRARFDSENQAFELSDQGVAALKHILLKIGVVDHFSGEWRLPPPNPFLRVEAPEQSTGLIRGQTSKHRGLRTFAQDRSRSRRESSPMQFSQTLPDNTAEGSMYLRWRLAFKPHPRLQQRLENRLLPLREDAGQAGVDVSFQASANEWLLKMTGLQAPMPTVLDHVLKTLTEPDADCLRQSTHSAALIPIKQLLQALPDHCLDTAVAESADLTQLWGGARWLGLATGLSAHAQAAMGLPLSRVPGVPGVADNQPLLPVAMHSQRLWTTLDTGSNEHALLLFCPAPTPSITDEAAWRLLAHLCQTPFYQRLRVELQLGYAVFSGLRQVHGQTGLLFGVQSPHASPVELMGHVQHFLNGLPELISALGDAPFTDQRQALAVSFDHAALPHAVAAELLWQGKLAGRPSDYLQQLTQAILMTERPTLLDAAYRLIKAEGGWRCLASGPGPEANGRQVK